MFMNNEINFKTKIEIAIETGMQLIPCVGGAVATAYFGTKQAKEFERIKSFYEELSREVEDIKDNIVSFDKQSESEMISLIEQINYKVEREHQQDKINYYKNYMKRILVDPVNSENYDKRKVFLEIIENTTLLELGVLGYLHNNYGKWATVRYVRYLNYTQYEIIGAINKLKSYGFLMTRKEDMIVGGIDSNTLSELITISNYGKEFVDFIAE